MWLRLAHEVEHHAVDLAKERDISPLPTPIHWDAQVLAQLSHMTFMSGKTGTDIFWGPHGSAGFMFVWLIRGHVYH